MSFPAAQCPVTYGHLPHDWRDSAARANESLYHRCAGIKIDPATRARPVAARHVVIGELRMIKDQLARRLGRWAVAGVDYDGDRLVPRRVGDFPENDAVAWGTLARMCQDAMTHLDELRMYAEAQRANVDEFD